MENDEGRLLTVDNLSRESGSEGPAVQAEEVAPIDDEKELVEFADPVEKTPAITPAGTTAPPPRDFHERMQGHLIWLFSGLLSVTVIFGAVGWLIGSDIRSWISFTTPVFTLAGTALAYYFGKSRNE